MFGLLRVPARAVGPAVIAAIVIAVAMLCAPRPALAICPGCTTGSGNATTNYCQEACGTEGYTITIFQQAPNTSKPDACQNVHSASGTYMLVSGSTKQQTFNQSEFSMIPHGTTVTHMPAPGPNDIVCENIGGGLVTEAYFTATFPTPTFSGCIAAEQSWCGGNDVNALAAMYATHTGQHLPHCHDGCNSGDPDGGDGTSGGSGCLSAAYGSQDDDSNDDTGSSNGGPPCEPGGPVNTDPDFQFSDALQKHSGGGNIALPHVYVTLAREPGDVTLAQIQTDGHGGAVFRKLPPGDYVFEVDGPSLAYAMKAIAKRSKQSARDGGSSFSIGIGVGGGTSSRGGGHQGQGAGPNTQHGGSQSSGGIGIGASIPLGNHGNTSGTAGMNQPIVIKDFFWTIGFSTTLRDVPLANAISTISAPYQPGKAKAGMRIPFTIPKFQPANARSARGSRSVNESRSYGLMLGLHY